MPLLKRKPVALIPTPNLDALSPDTQVFFLKATGEIFLDYDDYANRLSYLLCRIFQCESSGKTSLDYFAALESEKAESRVVRERFPDELKGRVLASVQFQVMGRLDTLVELVYDRFVDRYFAGEKVFVDLSGDKYFARIAKVFPPASVRRSAATAQPQPQPQPSTSTLPADAPPPPDTDDYSAVTHKIGTDLNVAADEARKEDDPDEYLYTVQLMDEEHKFEGSFMEVKGKALSRDRLAFSKSILKRYIRECVQRDAVLASPWIVKPAIAAQFGIPTFQSEEGEERNKKIREGTLAKRRKAPKEDESATGPAAKKRKKDSGKGALIKDEPESRHGTPVPKAPNAEPKRPIKYPIEDLDLDPMSIHDGRVLRRVNAELPALPPKPVPSRDLLVPTPLFDRFLMVWQMLNVFSKPLFLSTFSLDDFAGALRHSTRTPRCVLISEIHACLTNIIATDTSRVLGTTGAAANIPGENGWTEDMDEEEQFDRLIRKGITYSRRWDRSAKLKTADGREGWERHTIGALCQRGGPIALPNLPRILKHLFPVTLDTEVEADAEPAADADVEAESTNGDLASAAATAKSEEDLEIDELDVPEQASDTEVDDISPSEHYYTLPLEDKLDILNYLVTLVLGSKPIRSYVDDSETQLTEYRKQRADVNKERKALLEQKAIMEGKAIKTETTGNGTPVPMSDGAAPLIGGAGNGHASPSVQDTPVLGAPESEAAEDDDEDEIDELDDDDDAVGGIASGSGDDSMSVTMSEGGGPAGATLSRKAALEERRLEKLAAEQARKAEQAKQRLEAKLKNAGRKEADKARLELEDAIAKNAKKDDLVEREFRRFHNVTRARPLGKDRFFNRYWWFDGIGGMNLIGQGNGILYGTGRLFIQGPTQEDWDYICSRPGEDMPARRAREEVDPEATLQVNEWAFYEEEEEVEALLGWLNSKGTRELALKNALAKWRPYILAGSRRRQHDTSKPFQSADARRSTRSKNEPEHLKSNYLSYHNRLSKA